MVDLFLVSFEPSIMRLSSKENVRKSWQSELIEWRKDTKRKKKRQSLSTNSTQIFFFFSERGKKFNFS